MTMLRTPEPPNGYVLTSATKFVTFATLFFFAKIEMLVEFRAEKQEILYSKLYNKKLLNHRKEEMKKNFIIICHIQR